MAAKGSIKGHDLFEQLSVDEINTLNTISTLKKCKKNDTIFEHRAPGTHVFLLMKGVIYLKLYEKTQGISINITKIEKGDLFGLSPLLGRQRYTASASCITNCDVLFIEAKPFRKILQNNLPAGFQIINEVASIYFHRYLEILKNMQVIAKQLTMIK
jgi:CRP-like cAMP-binding protein